MTYLLDELGEFLVESQINHRSVLVYQLNTEKERQETYTTNNKDSLEITSLNLANLDSLLPDFLSLLVVQEESSLIIHQVLDRVLVDWGLTSLGGSSYDLKVIGEGVVGVSGFGEVPSDGLLMSLRTCLMRCTYFTIEGLVGGRENE
jgi:hypothetical protein